MTNIWFSGGGSTTIAPVHDGYVLQKVSLFDQVKNALPTNFWLYVYLLKI